MAPVAVATAPPAATSWPALAGTYATFALFAWAWARNSSAGGVVPLGAHGDSRFVLALVASAGLIIPPLIPADAPLQVLMLTAASFVLLLIAAALCGAADGSWFALARRHMQLSFFQTLRTFVRAALLSSACTWRIVTALQTPTAPSPATPELTPAQEKAQPDPSYIAERGARALVITVTVLVMGIVSFAVAPPVELSWTLVAASYPAFALGAFFLAWTHRSATVTIPLGTHGDSRVLFALLAMAIFAALPDSRLDELMDRLPLDEPVPPIEEGPPAWLIPATTEAFTRGLAPLPYALLLVASAACGAADGAWIAAAMRHLRLSFVQALRLYLATARAGAGDTWRGVRDGP